MKCYQCTRPAMYQVGEQNIPLCLDCYFKFSQINQQEIENNERMLNYLSDEIASTVGMPPMGPRFPERPRPVHVKGVALNNISVNNSIVGTINTGSIGNIDQSISGLLQLGEPQLADALKALSEAVLKSADLTKNQQNELIETLSVLAREAASPREGRQNAAAHTLMEKAIKVISTANDITEIVQKWWPILAGAFGGADG